MGRPEANIVFTDNLIDDTGTVKDDGVSKFLNNYLDAFTSWIARVGQS